MTTHPNCKINLGLHVVGRRPDGYHDLETIFVPVHSLCDTLEIEPGPLAMTQDGIALDNAPDDNLCMRAWRLMHERYGIPTVSIRLDKHIPYGAGLGGGSADAAFTLRSLDSLFGLGLDTATLESLATAIGADCAFFVANQTAFATGIGDRLQPIDLDLAAYDIRIAIPEGEHVATKEAYQGLDTSRFGQPRVDLREAIRQPVDQWRYLIENDFEQSVLPTHPAIAELKAKMYADGAAYASMTGSGAAVFGLFAR